MVWFFAVDEQGESEADPSLGQVDGSKRRAYPESRVVDCRKSLRGICYV